MDPSTPSVQDVHQQKSSNQLPNASVAKAAQPSDTSFGQSKPPPSSIQQKTPITISVGKEAGPATVMVAESPDAGEDDEDERVVAPQETKTQIISQSNGADIQEEVIEMQPAVPEFSTSPEVEKIVEKSPDQERPDLPKTVQDAGVTHSGPGIITVDKNNFEVTKMPETYEQAVKEEKKTQLHDSRHWFSAMIMYIWRKLNPTIGTKNAKEGKKEQRF